MIFSKSVVWKKANCVDDKICLIFSLICHNCFYMFCAFVGSSALAIMKLDSMCSEIFVHIFCKPRIIIAGKGSGSYIEKADIFAPAFRCFSNFHTDVSGSDDSHIFDVWIADLAVYILAVLEKFQETDPF